MSFDALQQLLVEVPVVELSDWLLVRRRLEGLASVAASDLVSLTRQRAVIELAFYGSLDQLLGQLEQRDLVLARVAGGGFGGTAGGVVVSGQGATGPLPGTSQAVSARPEPEWRLSARAAATPRAGIDAGTQGVAPLPSPGGEMSPQQAPAAPGLQQPSPSAAPQPNAPEVVQ